MQKYDSVSTHQDLQNNFREVCSSFWRSSQITKLKLTFVGSLVGWGCCGAVVVIQWHCHSLRVTTV